MLSFRAERKITELLDPRRQFAPSRIESEIRYDPLTGETARICHVAGVTPQAQDLREQLQATRADCPFCEPRALEVTPRFLPDMLQGFQAAGSSVADGRLVRGQARLFPNLFPYDEVSALVVVSRAHAMDAQAMHAGLVADAIILARDFFRHVRQGTPHQEDAHSLLTWNYLPASGSSQLHPHIQVALTRHPGNRLVRELRAQGDYLATHGRAYADDLLAAERDGPRWITQDDAASWLVPFAPTGVLGDACAVFHRGASVEELDDSDIVGFASTLVKLIACFARQGLPSFNLSFFSDAPTEASGRHRLVARLLPRLFLNNALHVCDASYLQLLLQEAFCMRIPEELAQQLRDGLSGR
jgi:galactose-1-phosphate uridylyltransferase